MRTATEILMGIADVLEMGERSHARSPDAKEALELHIASTSAERLGGMLRRLLTWSETLPEPQRAEFRRIVEEA